MAFQLEPANGSVGATRHKPGGSRLNDHADQAFKKFFEREHCEGQRRQRYTDDDKKLYNRLLVERNQPHLSHYAEAVVQIRKGLNVGGPKKRLTGRNGRNRPLICKVTDILTCQLTVNPETPEFCVLELRSEEAQRNQYHGKQKDGDRRDVDFEIGKLCALVDNAVGQVSRKQTAVRHQQRCERDGDITEKSEPGTAIRMRRQEIQVKTGCLEQEAEPDKQTVIPPEQNELEYRDTDEPVPPSGCCEYQTGRRR